MKKFISIIVIAFVIVTLYFILVPNLKEGNYILYNDKHYRHINQLEIPSEFIFYAQESGIEGKVIGREGLGLIRKTDCENVIYNYNTIGNNFVYALFKADDIPSVKEARKYTVSMHYRGDTEKSTDVVISKDALKVMKVLDDASQNTAVDYYSVDWNQFYCYQVCMDCKEFAGYYVIGYIYIGDGINYYRSCENMDICYEVSLEQITE